MTRLELILTNILCFGLGLFLHNMIQQFNSLLTKKINESAKKNANEIDAFECMLASHHNFLLLKAAVNTSKYEEHLKMIEKLLIWSKDEILYEYGAYMKKVDHEQINKITDREIHFAHVVLAFRKQRKYKNKNLEPETIALLFRGGFKIEI